jgi:hypothetical protein
LDFWSRIWTASLVSLALIALCPVTGTAAENATLPRQENQLWFDGQYAVPVHHRIDLIGSGGMRLGRGLDHMVYQRAGLFLAFKLLPFVTITPSFNYVATQPVAGKDTREHRYAVDATFAGSLHGFELNNRNRFERRVLPTVSYFRYMNRLQIAHPAVIGRQHLKLWIAEEVFYYGNVKAFSRNRISIGVSRCFNKRVAVDFYYLRQNDHYSRPGDINSFGISFKSTRD